jgi:hypothetical protein
MLEEEVVREECLYCHGQIKSQNSCPFCGDARLSESLGPVPSPQPDLMFHPGPIFEPKIAGV